MTRPDKDINDLVQRLEAYNRAYRSGAPVVSDNEYDRLIEQLRTLDPNHSFLKAVEPETFSGRRQVRHPVPMLSTEKAYTAEQLERFVARVEKEAGTTGLFDVTFRLTPKLDGLAGRDDGRILASRGNGVIGYDISNAFAKGVVPIGGRGQGVGEIVVVMTYFNDHLSEKFEHPRNMVVGIISADTLNDDARQALDDGMVHFVPYGQLKFWQGSGADLVAGIKNIGAELVQGTDYPMDGLVAEVVDPRLRTHMGATAHHYRWQIAIKRKGQIAATTVLGLQWQVGRTGNVTPVMEVAPTPLSGATIRRVTAHHAGMVREKGIGPGARIEIIRSGEVIPKLEKVLEPFDGPIGDLLPDVCPSCGQPLSWREDFLRCNAPNCPAQTVQRICHWFRILGNADWFGIKTVEKLVAAGFDSLEKIYAMDVETFAQLGFGPVQSQNLAEALTISRTRPVEDWRFLAAFGIPDLGTGDSRRLLSHFDLAQLTGLDADAIAAIHGFGRITSHRIVRGIKTLSATITHMLKLGFELLPTHRSTANNLADSPIAGKKILFTGKMQHGSRSEMQEEARQLGAQVQSAVSGATDLLVCGEKVGAAKISKATALGVTIISEVDYRQLIDPSGD